MINEARLVNTFSELVRIDSETGDEGKIFELLKRKCEALGLEVKEDQAKRKTGHGANILVCTLRGTKKGTVIFLGTHMDTVLPGKGVEPVIKDGYITSDGTTILGSDDKAGIAAILEAIQTMNEEQQQHAEVQFIITIGEESGLLGVKALDMSLVHADYGFVLDSDGPVGDVVVAAPYQAKLAVDLFGKPAHAGIEPEKGVSAITLAAKAIAKMPLGRIDNDTTANIGSFEGGKATNIVCDYVKVIAETRSLVKEKMETQIMKMNGAFEDTAMKMGGKAEVHVDFMYPGYKFGSEDAVVRLASRAIEAVGRTPHLFQSGGGSDANVFCSKGIPTVNLGVGYENIHTVKEKIAIKELAKTTELVLALVDQAVEKD
ncbi:M20/M25/M40 family metallo-hydrolase [Sporolactobacillus shoreicorticis]|uniref:M20/M25/M40 family metallo-hydrolase n=1 Tax=Sporolactobacillus shoreicorticis TaxID=1923877 RepID=A0ABW5RZN5_9BACL|nr:M20/M25/M40 family metallo-hydrolase [Sporolactobacillus shoreicorticis]MCO7126788.1 M20/M25/M40 family metallo-hydrolase [Sporolactobacillus shoreicorticis]